MFDLKPIIASIEADMQINNAEALTFAALKCRLAIEYICYEHLKFSYDFISYKDVLRWQPAKVMQVLLEDVDENISSGYELSISKGPALVEPAEEKEWISIGSHVGFDVKRLNKIWQSLSNVALHVSFPKQKSDKIKIFKEPEEIRKIISQSVEEIKKISDTKIIMSSIKSSVSINCKCGVKISRKIDRLMNGKIVNCFDINCEESYEVEKNGENVNFVRRTTALKCRKCADVEEIPTRFLEKIPRDKHAWY
jgi:hypothetical protein